MKPLNKSEIPEVTYKIPASDYLNENTIKVKFRKIMLSKWTKKN